MLFPSAFISGYGERIAAPPPVDSNHSNNSYELCNLFFISAVPPTALPRSW